MNDKIKKDGTIVSSFKRHNLCSHRRGIHVNIYIMMEKYSPKIII